MGFLPEYLPAVRNSRIGTLGGTTDVFVAKFQADGALEGWTVFGDTGDDIASSLVVGASGELYVAGSSSSRRFQWRLPDGSSGLSAANPDDARDGFVARLDPTGAQLDGFVARVRVEPEPVIEWASYVGGTGRDEVLAVRVDNQSQDRLFIGGFTSSVDLRYADAGVDTNLEGSFTNDMFLLAVDLNRSPGGGTTTPGGGGGGEEPEGGLSPLGWSCGASGPSGGVGALALGSLVGLALLASRRRPRA